MSYTLYREVDGEWYAWGTYNVCDPRQLRTLIDAAHTFIEVGRNIKVIPDQTRGYAIIDGKEYAAKYPKIKTYSNNGKEYVIAGFHEV